MIKFVAKREQFLRSQVMGRHPFCVGSRKNGRECDRTRQGIDGAIDKQDGRGAGYVFGEFRSPLMVGDDAHASLLAEALFRPVSKPKPDTIIPA